ncbi:MAG: Synechococcus phage [Cyanobacteriota bacterium]|jgi:hypothetical protein
MTTRREQILSAIATALASTSGVGGRVYRSRVDAFSRNEAPAIVIEAGPDRAQTYSICKLDWTLDVLVVVHTRGQIPDQLADPIIADAHSKLMADRTLGGLVIDIVPTLSDPQRDKADLTSLWQVNTYQVRYRTAVDDLSSP